MVGELSDVAVHYGLDRSPRSRQRRWSAYDSVSPKREPDHRRKHGLTTQIRGTCGVPSVFRYCRFSSAHHGSLGIRRPSAKNKTSDPSRAVLAVCKSRSFRERTGLYKVRIWGASSYETTQGDTILPTARRTATWSSWRYAFIYSW